MVKTILILAFILLLYVIYSSFVSYNEVLYVRSKIDNNVYQIRTGRTKTAEYLQESADALARINQNCARLIAHIAHKYAADTSKNYFIRRLTQRYHAGILSEAARDNRYTTFTVNKKDMHICLRTRDTFEQLYDANVLMYVVLHELAHLCNYDVGGRAIQGHGTEFRNIFKFLVEEAIEIGVYAHIQYAQHPQEYCGITINTSIV